MAFMLSAGMLAGCTSGQAGSASGSGEPEDSASTGGSKISVISREDGSGTRSAFVELFGIKEDGEDKTAPDAEITNSTAVMIETVNSNPNAIGYISLGSLSDKSKAVSIDGVSPSVETINDQSYPITRSFLLVEKEGDDNPLAADFIDYVLSKDGQAIIEEEGYVPLETSKAYTSSGQSGSLTIGGSSSVTPVMEKLAESYQKLNDKSELSVLQTDSTTGITSTSEGVYDLGMSSRALSDEEKSSGLKDIPIANDGIVVIVNPENEVSDLSKDDVKQIYTAQIETWNELMEQ